MKFNWFHGLMLVLIAFISMMTYFVVSSSRTNLDLVSEKYYEEEINYQQRIDNTTNAKALNSDVQMNVENGFLVVRFPSQLAEKSITGNLKMYSPVGKKNDKSFAVNSINGEYKIDVSQIQGKYSLQLDWSCEQQNYYSEQKIFL